MRWIDPLSVEVTVICLVVGLLLGGIWVLVIRRSRKRPVLVTGKYRACPHCAKQIREEAIVCRFCGKYISEIQYRDVDMVEDPECFTQATIPERSSFTLFDLVIVVFGIAAVVALAAVYLIHLGVL
ncbi:MAG: hypothetical protein V1793_01145 [Pseudomonadota bacterium]